MVKHPPVSIALKKLIKILQNNAFQCYMVGGAIRSHLLGKASKDVDLATDAKPEDIVRLFRRVIPTGIAHGTVTVLIDKEAFEITTFRSDGKYSDGRRPDSITFIANIEDDLKRRDFTINSIAYDLINKSYFDPNDGEQDLALQLIKAIGNAEERFKEDGLRPLRAIRFVGQLGFSIERETFLAIQKCAYLTANISRERITEELSRILSSYDVKKALLLFYESHMLNHIYPEFTDIDKAKIYKAIEHLAKIRPSYLELRTAIFFRVLDDDSKVATDKFIKLAKNYRYSNSFIKKVAHLISCSNFTYNMADGDAQFRRLIKQLELENVPYFYEWWLATADSASQTKIIEQFYERFHHLKDSMVLNIDALNVNGSHLLLMGIKGRAIGQCLDYLLNQVLDEPACNNKEKLLNYAKEWQKGGG